MKIVYILAGGALGTAGRYFMTSFTHRYVSDSFPTGTLLVNIIGSFIIGILFGIFDNYRIPANIRMFLFIGFLGGFTTFSTYALDTMNLFKDGNHKLALFNILSNNVLGLLMVIGGFLLARYLMTTIKP